MPNPGGADAPFSSSVTPSRHAVSLPPKRSHEPLEILEINFEFFERNIRLEQMNGSTSKRLHVVEGVELRQLSQGARVADVPGLAEQLP